MQQVIAFVVAFCSAALIALPALQRLTGVHASWLYFVVLAVWAGVAIFHVVVIQGGKVAVDRRFLLFVCLWVYYTAWLAFTVTWAEPREHYVTPIIHAAGAAVILLILAVTASQSAVETFLKLTVWMGVGVGLYTILDYVQSGALNNGLRGYDTSIAEDYLTISHVLGAATVIAVLQTVRRGGKARTFLGIFLFCSLALSLARGALLSAGVVSVVFSFILARALMGAGVSKRRQVATLAQLGVLPLVVTVAGVLAFQVERTRTRFLRLFTGGELFRSERTSLWAGAWDGIVERPIHGHGIGSSGTISSGIDGYYPHNLFLQVWVDGGLPAVLMLLGIVVAPFTLMCRGLLTRQRPLDPLVVIMVALYAFCVLEYSKSFNFYAGRSFVIIAGFAMWSLTRHSSCRPSGRWPLKARVGGQGESARCVSYS